MISIKKNASIGIMMKAWLTSSIVTVFHNEGWSALRITVHSVIKRTPRKCLAKIMLIDDFSNKEHLKEEIDNYIILWNSWARW
jgi:polypeptide N-acetylgalactosaminyltransferase